MTKMFTKLALIGSIAFALASPLAAAPVSPADQGNYRSMERHEARDVQTGNYGPHGTMTQQQRDTSARENVRGSTNAPAQPAAIPSADFPS